MLYAFMYFVTFCNGLFKAEENMYPLNYRQTGCLVSGSDHSIVRCFPSDIRNLRNFL